MMERQSQSIAKIEGWEQLTDRQKNFLCHKKFFGSDSATCAHIREKAPKLENGRVKPGRSVTRKEVWQWRTGNPDFARAEQLLLKSPLEIANALLDDMLPIAAYRQLDALMSNDIRTAQSAATTVFKAKGILGDKPEGGGRVVVIMPAVFAEREEIAGTTSHRLIESVPASLGTGVGTQIEQENQGSELGEEVG